MNIVSAQYYKGKNASDGLDTPENAGVILDTGDKVLHVPLDPANRHYAEIMRQVEAGELTIQEADSE
jgi:hypothetical protein